MIDDRTDMIRVTNGNATVVGRFNGTDYHFKQDVPIDVPTSVAQHVFAFGFEDKTVALNRLGWARTSEEIETGLAKLGKVVFDEPPDMVEAPKRPGRARLKAVPSHKTGSAGPPVDASGAEGEASASPEGHEGTAAEDEGDTDDEF